MACAVSDVVRVLAANHGLDVSQFDDGFIARTIERRIALTGTDGAAAYCDLLAADQDESVELERALRITHSEFFRDPLTFALLEEQILPQMMAANDHDRHRELRIWSAGCAAGQEAYSVAILLEDLGVLRGRPAPYRAFATDICSDALSAGRAGVYSADCVGKVRLRQRERYLRPEGDWYRIDARLRSNVEFSTYDLLDDRSSSPPASIFGGFDLVLCCNLLFYYRAEARIRILQKVRQSLSTGGVLVTSEVERGIVEGLDGIASISRPFPVFRTTDQR